MINDQFCENLLNVAYVKQRLQQALNLLQKLLFVKEFSSFDKIWDENNLERIPNLSIVIINFLSKIGRQQNFIHDERLFGNLILLVLQLESCNTNQSEQKINTKASEVMRGDEISKMKVSQ